MQPTIGPIVQIAYNPMNSKTKSHKPKVVSARSPKRPKVPGFMRHILAANVKSLMDLHFREQGDRPKALAAEAGVSKSTVQRILQAELGASLDNIEAIASALHASAYQMLIPNLNPSNPQVVQGATKDEERMFRQWRKASEERHSSPSQL